MAVNRKDIAADVANEFGIAKKTADDILAMFVESIEGYVKSGDEVAIAGLGKFKLAKRKARKARNPKTGETFIAPAKTVVGFKMASTLKKVE